MIDQGGKLLNEIRDAVTGTYAFSYISPGTVRVRVVEDLNGNGEWDPGDLVNRRQPERVQIYADDQGGLDRVTRANWEEELEMDMSEMFAPISMESVNRDIEQREMARMKEQLERKAEQERMQQQRSNSRRGNTFNPTDGFGI